MDLERIETFVDDGDGDGSWLDTCHVYAFVMSNMVPAAVSYICKRDIRLRMANHIFRYCGIPFDSNWLTK